MVTSEVSRCPNVSCLGSISSVSLLCLYCDKSKSLILFKQGLRFNQILMKCVPEMCPLFQSKADAMAGFLPLLMAGGGVLSCLTKGASVSLPLSLCPSPSHPLSALSSPSALPPHHHPLPPPVPPRPSLLP